MPTYFPSADITGIPNSRWYAAPLDYQAITENYEFEDGGKDFNEVAPAANAPRRWQVGFMCVGATHAEAKTQADVYEDFFNTVRYSQPFRFTDKYGDVWDNVFVEDFKKEHDSHKSWVISVTFGLVGYGSAVVDATPPGTISDLSATPSGLGAELDWTPPTDS